MSLILSSASVVILTVLSVATSSYLQLIYTVLLLALLLHLAPDDLASKRFLTPLLLAGGVAISYAISLPVGSTGLSTLDSLQIIVNTALPSAFLIYAVLLVSTKVAHTFSSGGSVILQLSIFPLLWSLAWATFCRFHSLGRLLTWTPVAGLLDSFPTLVLPLLGLPGYDYLTGALAVSLVYGVKGLPTSDATGSLSNGTGGSRSLVDLESEDESLPDERSRLLPLSRRYIIGSAGAPGISRQPAIWLGLAILLLSTVSNVVYSAISSAPLNPLHTVKVGCVLPPLTRIARQGPKAYYDESAVVTARGAKVVLWPESAIDVTTANDNYTFYGDVSRLASSRRAFIAPSYSTAVLHDRKTIATTLFGPTGEVVYTYDKQALVPLVESYSYTSGNNSLPTDKQIRIPLSLDTRRSSSSINDPPASISISTAICHDTSFPHIMSQTPYADLVLVPSSVFSTHLGWTRIRQLQVSALALGGTDYLICDGGGATGTPSAQGPSRGISAFIDGQGRIKHWQQGYGSSEINASMGKGSGNKYTSPYAKYGEAGSLAILAAIVALLALLEMIMKAGRTRMREIASEVLEAFRRRWYGLAGYVRRGGRRQESNMEEDDLLR